MKNGLIIEIQSFVHVILSWVSDIQLTIFWASSIAACKGVCLKAKFPRSLLEAALLSPIRKMQTGPKQFNSLGNCFSWDWENIQGSAKKAGSISLISKSLDFLSFQ